MHNTAEQDAETSSKSGSLRQHDHPCLIYETPVELAAAFVPYLRAGLLLGERCIYFTDENNERFVLEAMQSGEPNNGMKRVQEQETARRGTRSSIKKTEPTNGARGKGRLCDEKTVHEEFDLEPYLKNGAFLIVATAKAHIKDDY